MKHYFFLVLGFSIIAIHSFCQTAQEKALMHKADAFITAHRADWDSMEVVIDKLTDNASGRKQRSIIEKQPFFIAYKKFLAENKAALIAARTVRLKQYAAPPQPLFQLNWQTPSSWSDEENNTDLLAISWLRNFDPAFPAYMAYSIITPSLHAQTNTSIEEARNLYKIRDLYSIRLYTRQVTDTVWQVWAADRCIAVTFRFNVYNGAVSAIQYALPPAAAWAVIQWPPSSIAPADSAQQLTTGLSDIKWQSYSGVCSAEAASRHLPQRNQSLLQYYRQHQQQFIRMRTSQLQQLKQEAPALTGYQERPPEQGGPLAYVDTTFYAMAFIRPDNWASVISASSAYLLSEDARTIAKLIQRNHLFPSSGYARRLNEQEWEVWTVNESDAVFYIWNIYSGAIHTIHYYVRKNQ